jgi:iron complex outermembrane receptor protein
MNQLLIAFWLAAAPQTPASSAPPRITADVVVTATLVPTPDSSVARTVTVLTRADLERIGISSVVDALRLVPGLDVRARGPRDVQADLSVRGATFGQQLVLADGVRLNDAQSGHHNGELPVPLVALDRIEVVGGAGSAVHGADALGGTINVITRRDQHGALSASIGEHNLAGLSASIGGYGLPETWTLSGWSQRSDGFSFDRDFALGGAMVRGDLRPGLTLDARHQRRSFGAFGFYGASPSKEWTDLTLTSLAWATAHAGWSSSVRGTFKNHGDHFRWDINRPGFAENTHRTNAGELVASVSHRDAGGRVVTVGASGGADRVRSNNLGNHDFSRTSAFAEVQLPVSARLMLQAGARADHYSTFGSQLSPSFSGVFASQNGFRVRAALSRAFRVPTFTELYYLDPNNEGDVNLTAERDWSLDGGIEYANHGWLVSATPFTRWDKNVIDYVRPTATVRWHATNIRDVTTRGIELSASRHWNGAMIRSAYTMLDVDAPSLSLLSKYVLEYARHSFVTSAAAPLGATGFGVSATADYRKRLDGQTYTLVDARISYSRRAWRDHASVYVGASNVLDAEYHEIAGVTMPGRWITAGVTIH